MLNLYVRLQVLANDEKGAAAAEYALILAIIGSAIAASALIFGDSIASVFTRASARMALITF
ncbi:Flp family type IVb pilin [Novosphingobium sp.]|uniref:Flp family type IVb pilin n=1 Tax=Novosphingobium sp. TaxID=1874826 RepID=UPI00286C6B6F|nr:Flp family type IVb pilin [Novosphingobium sp.]